MATAEIATSTTLPQRFVEAFRIFEARNLELHPCSAACFELLNGERIVASVMASSSLAS